MQVNIFVSEVIQDGQPSTMLVLPVGPDAKIPKHLQNIEWRYLATTEADDRIIGMERGEVEVAISTDGYLVTKPRLPHE
jgi:hypothetical protein